MGKPFIRLIKAGLDPPQKMCYLSALIQRKCQASTHKLPLYGNSSIQTLIGQFGRDLPSTSLEGTEFEKAAIVSSDLSTEWKTYRQLLIKQPKDDISMQLKIAFLPNLHTLATICLSIPISTASAEQSFSDMKLIKNCLCNHSELSLSNLMKIVINLPKNSLIVIWKKLTCGIEKVDGLLCKLSFRLLSYYICILSLLMHLVKHLSTSIMNFNNTISRASLYEIRLELMAHSITLACKTAILA